MKDSSRDTSNVLDMYYRMETAEGKIFKLHCGLSSTSSYKGSFYRFFVYSGDSKMYSYAFMNAQDAMALSKALEYMSLGKGMSISVGGNGTRLIVYRDDIVKIRIKNPKYDITSILSDKECMIMSAMIDVATRAIEPQVPVLLLKSDKELSNG